MSICDRHGRLRCWECSEVDGYKEDIADLRRRLARALWKVRDVRSTRSECDCEMCDVIKQEIAELKARTR